MRRALARLGHEVIAPTTQEKAARSSVWMHGILGSRKNWRTPARKVISLYPDYQAVVVDHRGHGTSEGGEGPHTLEACASDLHHLLTEEVKAKPHICAGHSFGGKVALAYAQACIENGWDLPRHTWVFDSLPGAVDRHRAIGEQSVAEVIEKLEEVPLPFPSKDEMARHLIHDKKVPPFIANWLMTSLKRAPDNTGYEWAFSLPVIRQLFNSYTETDFHDLLASWPLGHELHMIRASKNNAWTDEVMRKIELIQRDTKNVHLHTLDAGHWVHVDDPQGLLRLVGPTFEAR